MSIFNNKGKIIGGSMAGAKKVISKEVATLQAQMDNLENQLTSLKIEHERVLEEVESLRKTVETLASESLESK